MTARTTRGRVARLETQILGKRAEESAFARQKEINAGIERTLRRIIAGEMPPISEAERQRQAAQDEQRAREDPRFWEKRAAMMRELRRLVGEKDPPASQAGGSPATTDELAPTNGGAVTK